MLAAPGAAQDWQLCHVATEGQLSKFSQYPPPHRFPPRWNSDWPYLRGGPVRCPTAQARAFPQHRPAGPTPFSQFRHHGNPNCRACAFYAVLAFRLLFLPVSPLPPSLFDGLLCGSTESPTPFLCGITMAAGVGLPALAIQVTVSDAILCPSGTSRRQRSSGAEWGTDPGLEAILSESRVSRPRRGTGAGTVGRQRGGMVWVRGEKRCPILAVWVLRKRFGFMAASRREIRAG